VYLSYFDPIHGDRCVIGVGALRQQHLEQWLLPLGLTAEAREQQAQEALEALVEFDHAGYEWRHAPAGMRSNAARWRREKVHRLKGACAGLSSLLATGLEAVEDAQVAEENVWVHLAARKIAPPAGSRAAALRVCEQCAVVFPAPRANRCTPCRHRPLNIKLHPAFDGGSHTDYRADVTPDSRRLVWLGICQGCKREFESDNSRTPHCANCRSGPGRVRRARNSTTRGRQRWTFTNERGDLMAAVGLTAHDGVIETDDAEAAARLRATPGIIEVARATTSICETNPSAAGEVDLD